LLAIAAAIAIAVRERRGSAARAEAARLIEEARPELEAAAECLYDATASRAELLRRTSIAKERIARAIDLAPDDPLAHHWMGRARDVAGETAGAEAAWRRAVAIAPGFSPARVQLARRLVEESFAAGLLYAHATTTRDDLLREAAAHLREAAATGFDGELERELARAMSAYADGNYDGMERIARDGIARYGTRRGAEEFHFLLGLVLRHVDHATPDLDRAIALKPRHATARFVRAVRRYHAEEWRLVIDDLNVAVEVRPAFAYAYMQRGLAHHRAGELESAVLDLTEALRLSPHFAAACYNRGRVREDQRDPEGAIADYREALALDPAMAEAWDALGVVFATRGRTADAIDALTKAIEAKPDVGSAWYNRGRARRDAGDREGGCADYAEAGRRGVHQAWRMRAHLREEMGDPAGALEDYGRAVAADPKDANALSDRGALRKNRGDPDGAIDDCTRAIAIDGRHAEAWANRGLARGDKGDFEGAAKDLETALRVALPDWPGRALAEEYLAKARARIRK
jgi:tetratricopeptide (TPR) repeat protein